MMRYKYGTPSGSVTHILSNDAINIGPLRGRTYILSDDAINMGGHRGRYILPIRTDIHLYALIEIWPKNLCIHL